MINLKINKRLLHLAVVTTMGSCIVVGASVVSAEPGLYVGGAIGWGRVDGSDFDDDNAVYKIFAGGKFNDYIGVEIAANDYGEAERGIFASELTGNTAAVVGYWPLGDNFELFAKAGNMWWRDKVTVLGTYDDTISGDEIFYGLGANFKFNESLALRVEMERYKVDLSQEEIGVDLDDTYNVDVASVGMAFSF